MSGFTRSKNMGPVNKNYLVYFLIALSWAGWGLADLPCAARTTANESVACVCNETYCDEITRVVPGQNAYVAYVSSKAGLRFNKTEGTLETGSTSSKNTILTISDTLASAESQTIKGFGGAVTDASSINWKNLSETLQQTLINSYFSEQGLEYNMIRVPIGGSDFSEYAYAYNEYPEGDTLLSNFSLTTEDYEYKIPMIKAAMEAAKVPVHVVATTWSPPLWMKTNNAYYGISSLKEEYYQTYADYHYKFIEKYNESGVPIWAVTTTNEPANGVIPLVEFNSLGWTASTMGKWIAENLGPTIRNSSFKEVKILGCDDQRYTIPFWFDLLIKEVPAALDYLDGVAVHYYGDVMTPACILTHIPKENNDIFLLATEACEGANSSQDTVLIGSWDRAKNYILDILEDLNHIVTGWIDWNLCLNAQGGPNWSGNFADSPIIVYPENGEFIKQPMFYAMGHVTKFLPRGSRRLNVEENHPLLKSSLKNVAFLTPDNTTVVVVYNNDGSSSDVEIKDESTSRLIKLTLDAHSITTVEYRT